MRKKGREVIGLEDRKNLGIGEDGEDNMNESRKKEMIEKEGKDERGEEDK